MACHRLCHNLIEEGFDTNRIVIYSEEPTPPYDRANLSKLLHTHANTPPLLNHQEWYGENGISLNLSKKVKRFDPEQKQLYFADGSTCTFHQLVLATGKRPLIPDIEGTQHENVFTYRNWHDLLKIQSYCQSGRKIAIIGGGLLGLEIAEALHKNHCNITIYEAANTLLCKNLSETAGNVLLQSLEKLGIHISLKRQIKRIESNSEKLTLMFQDLPPVEVDGIILATGAKPSDEIAKESGILVSPKGGILVNESLTTNHQNIFALGDCASFRHESYGFVQPAYEQADVLAARLCGKDQTYVPKGCDRRLNILGIEISTYGENLGDGDHLVHSVNGNFRSLVINQGKLIGATIIGKWKQSTALGVAVREQLRMPHRQKKAFNESGHLELLTSMGSVNSWPAKAVVCNCTQMNCQSIKNAISEGFDTLTTLEKYTQAGGQCGSCRPLLLGLMHPEGNDVSDNTPVSIPPSKPLRWVAMAGLVICLLYWIPWQIPAPESVSSWNYKLSQIWTDFLSKQITGYATAGLSLGSLLLSLRKRIRWFKWGEFAFWKTLHASLGASTLLTLFFHTGLSMGNNLNFWLATSFLGLNTLGALAAIGVASKDASTHIMKNRFRTWMTRLHIIFFWPYPLLLAAHIYKVYQY